jgi:TatD DNase family protein
LFWLLKERRTKNAGVVGSMKSHLAQDVLFLRIFVFMYVDTHTHFYDEWLLPEAEEAILRALETGVGKMIQADVDSHERPAMWEIGNRHPGVLHQMLGLYPGSVAENWKEELDLVFALAKGDARSLPGMSSPVVAIGEIGLDYHEGLQFVKEQNEALRLQLELAASMNLPVNIHLRDAWEDFLSLLADCKHLNLRGNLHCFTSSYEIYERANRYGDFSVGIGGVVTFRNASIARTLERIPLERILLETDAPYLAPVPFRGRRNESAYLPYVAAKVAEIKGVSVEEAQQITTSNALKLFNI